jgi:hypothetical protein
VTSFLAVDGESVGGDHDQRYTLLAAGTGHTLWEPAGLRTQTILRWLCERQQPALELVCFGLNYDVNHWLRDIPQAYLRELWETGVIVWNGWKIHWAPGRRLSVKDLEHGAWAIVQEVFGFFDSSFVVALERHGITVPERLRAMKAARGTFTNDRAELEGYCLEECRLLEQLMHSLADAAADAGCTPYAHWWIGAGALASTLLREHDLLPHHAHDAQIASDSGTEAIMHAYIGARNELLRQGPVTAVRTYDLRSAYPAATLSLPSLRGARLVPRRSYRPAAHAIWHVKWSRVRGDIMPLPVRHGRAVYWPAAGEGWYHACEVDAARTAGFQLDVGGGFELTRPGTPASPFQFVTPLYRQRLLLERAGHDVAARVIKTALNAIYGKLAQGHTFERGLPKWQSYFWAGELTARVRATMLPVLLAADRPVMVATDGLFAAHAPARHSQRLGGWRHGQLDWLFALQPGVYQGYDHGREVIRSTGFFAGDIDYRQLYEAWQDDGTDMVHRYTSRRFIGLGISLQRENLRLWREWLNEPRSLHAHPRRKDPEYDAATGGYILHPVARAPGPSEPYVKKERLLDSRDQDNEQGMDQPLKTRV